jgi:hypothetical protein
MLVFFAYAGSLLAMVAGAVVLFQTVVGVGHADRSAHAAVQARTAQASITKPAVSSASKVAEPGKADKSERLDATKPKRVAQSRPKPRVAQRRQDYRYNYPGYGYYGHW